MGENYDGQGKSQGEEVYGAMVALLAAVGISLAFLIAVVAIIVFSF